MGRDFNGEKHHDHYCVASHSGDLRDDLGALRLVFETAFARDDNSVLLVVPVMCAGRGQRVPEPAGAISCAVIVFRKYRRR